MNYTRKITQKRALIVITLVLFLFSCSGPTDSINNSGDQKTFYGFFQNADYQNPSKYLRQSAQTKPDNAINAIAAKINNNRDISTLKEIFAVLVALPDCSSDKGKFNVTAAQILAEGMNGCHRYAILFASLARAKGIPTVIVECADVDWVKLIQTDPSINYTSGHVLVEVLLSDEKWYLVDSTSGMLFFNYNNNNFSIKSGNMKYYVLYKALDVNESGLTDYNVGTILRSNFAKFDINIFKDPGYNTIWLR